MLLSSSKKQMLLSSEIFKTNNIIKVVRWAFYTITAQYHFSRYIFLDQRDDGATWVFIYDLLKFIQDCDYWMIFSDLQLIYCVRQLK